MTQTTNLMRRARKALSRNLEKRVQHSGNSANQQKTAWPWLMLHKSFRFAFVLILIRNCIIIVIPPKIQIAKATRQIRK